MTKDLYFSRRAALKFAGKASLILPLGRLFTPAYALPASGRRLVIISSELPASNTWWIPRGTETNWDINFDGATLAPFNALKNDMLVLHGLGYKAAGETGSTENHENRAVALTALKNNSPSGPNTPTGASIDSLIVKAMGETKPFYGGIEKRFSDATVSSYEKSPGVFESPTDGVSNPQAFFDVLFKGVTASSASTSAPAPRVAAKTSMLDKYLADLQSLQAQGSAADKARLDDHLTALRNLEKNLTQMTQVGSGCTIPNRPDATVLDRARSHDLCIDLADAYYSVMAQALACNATRFMGFHHAAMQFWKMYTGLEYRDAPYDPSTPAIGKVEDGDDSFHNMVLHNGSYLEQYKNNEQTIRIRDVHRAQSTSIAKFVQNLKNAKDADGTSVLDNTIVMWISQLSDPKSHTAGRIPIVLFGGAGVQAGTMRMGRFLDFTDGKPITDMVQLLAKNNKGHNGLLVSLANTYGVNITEFGGYYDSSYEKGPLARLT